MLLSTPTRPQKATPIWKPIILTRRGYDIRSESNSPCNEVKETIAWLTGIRISHLHWYSMNNSFLELPRASSLLKFDATIDMYCLQRSTLLALIFDTLKSLPICTILYPIHFFQNNDFFKEIFKGKPSSYTFWIYQRLNVKTIIQGMFSYERRWWHVRILAKVCRFVCLSLYDVTYTGIDPYARAKTYVGLPLTDSESY